MYANAQLALYAFTNFDNTTASHVALDICATSGNTPVCYLEDFLVIA